MQITQVGPWYVAPGQYHDVEYGDSHFVFYDDTAEIRGEDWPPSIFSYYGHPVPLPNVSIAYLGRGRRHWNLLVTFRKRRYDASLGLLVEFEAATVPAWQGDNNLIHLLEPLPGEDDLELDMQAMAEAAHEVDADYLTRIRLFFPGAGITETAPELFAN